MTHFEHQVRERAYYIWEDEGRVFGRADEHWLRAETELRASPTPAPVLVQAVAPSLTLAASPAEILGESLKAKPSRTRSVTAKVEAKVKAAAKTAVAAEPAPKSAKSSATKTASIKTAATTTKSAPAAKTATAKPAASKSAVARAPKAAARPRAAEAVATVH